MQLGRMKVLFSIGTSIFLLATIVVFISISMVSPTPSFGATACDSSASLTSPLVASPTSGDTSTQFAFSGTIANCNSVDNSGAQPLPLGITLRGISDDPNANGLIFGLKTDFTGAFVLKTPLTVGGWTFEVWNLGNALSGNNSIHLIVSQGAAYVCGDTVGVANLPTCSSAGQLNCCPQGCPDQADIDGPLGCTGGSGGTGGPCQQPPQPYPADLALEITNKWFISIRNVGADQLRWIYEIFYAVQGTRFLELVKGAEIDGVANSVSQQVDCPSNPGADVLFGNTYGETATKQLIIHELAHVIQSCQPDSISHMSETRNAVAAEGFLTTYSANPCFSGVDQYNEDYAETLGFHLNPNTGEITCGSGPNPFAGGAHPAHKALAIKVVADYSCSL